jgi:phosphate transport system ATP-binding protein
MNTTATLGIDNMAMAAVKKPTEGTDVSPFELAAEHATVGSFEVENAKMSIKNVNVYYGDKQAIFDVSVDIGKNEVIAMIGPSGCGKSTFLRALNRMNDTVDGCRVEGDIRMDGQDLYSPKLDGVQACGTRSKIAFIKPELVCREASSSGCVLPGRSPSVPRLS